MTDLRQLLGPAADARVVKSKLVTAFESEFNMELHDGELSLTEHVRYQRALSEIDTPDWVNLLRQPVVGAPLCAGQQIISGGLLQQTSFMTALHNASNKCGSVVMSTTVRAALSPISRRPCAGTFDRSRRSHD